MASSLSVKSGLKIIWITHAEVLFGMSQTEILKNLRHNFIVNVLDGAFFGAGLGFASFVTVIPLFVNSLTDSTTIIGLIAALHVIGWQLPQLFTARKVAGLRLYKPMVLRRTIEERWPFLGLAVVALLIPVVSNQTALALTFVLVLWHSLGGGFTATAWQSMISKIMTRERVGTFFGAQSAAANLMSALTAVVAGWILLNIEYPYNFALCFFITGILMTISWVFLWRAREIEHEPRRVMAAEDALWPNLRDILRRDVNFRWFVGARVLAQFAWMATSFYTIYAVREYQMDEQTAGLMTSVLLLGQTLANPIIGWVGDRFGHRRVFVGGLLVMTVSIALALASPQMGWFYVIFGLAGLAQAVFWTTTMAMTVEFGDETDRPYYIGLTNTLIAPATILAPIAGGWLVDAFGFHVMFLVALTAGLLGAVVLQVAVLDPRRLRPALASSAMSAE